jgi:hypothetical protein
VAKKAEFTNYHAMEDLRVMGYAYWVEISERKARKARRESTVNPYLQKTLEMAELFHPNRQESESQTH